MHRYRWTIVACRRHECRSPWTAPSCFQFFVRHRVHIMFTFGPSELQSVFGVATRVFHWNSSAVQIAVLCVVTDQLETKNQTNETRITDSCSTKSSPEKRKHTTVPSAREFHSFSAITVVKRNHNAVWNNLRERVDEENVGKMKMRKMKKKKGRSPTTAVRM